MKNYAEMTNKELKELCTQRGLAVSGNKQALIDRLTLSDAGVDMTKQEPQKAEDKPITSAYAINAMLPALKLAHNTGNKGGAINTDLCKNVGVSEERLNAWKITCQTLLDTIEPYILEKHKLGAIKEEVEKLRSAIFPKWKEVVGVTKESTRDKGVWLIEWDIDSLVGYAEKFVVINDEGVKTLGMVGYDAFRNKVETLLGIRIAQKQSLNREESDTVQAYFNAKNRIRSLDRQINGYTVNETHHAGLIEKIDAEETFIKEQKTSMEQVATSLKEQAETLNLVQGVMTKVLNEHEVALKDLKKSLEDAKKALKDTKAQYAEVQDKAEEILKKYEDTEIK